VDESRKLSEAGKPPEAPAKHAATLDVLSRAQAGDESVMGAFKEMLDHPTAGPKLVEWFGDLAARAREFAVDEVAQTNLAIKAATPRKMAALRAELEGPDPSPIERLLVERVVFCWLILWEYESVLALQAGKQTASSSAFHHRRIDAAHRRYLSSLRALATVRKLAVPDVRVNVGTHHHHDRGRDQAEPARPCNCHDGAELPTFANRLSASR
jgi:hypothetical protein